MLSLQAGDSTSPAGGQRRKRIEQMVKDRAKGMTLEAIGEKYGVSEMQVRRDLGEATSEGSEVATPPAKIKGKDGKERPAKYKPRKPKAETPAVAASLGA